MIYLDSTYHTLLEILSYRVQYQSDKQAYIFLQDGETESDSITYGELDKQARVIAAHLQSFQGERALLLYPSGLEFITAFFGCLYAGVIAVPVYPPRRNQKLSRLLSIVKDAQPIIALTTTSILADIEKRWTQEPELAQLKLEGTDNIESKTQEFVPEEISLDSLAFLQYTSGSTGIPKGVMVTHGNIIHNQQIIQTAFGHTEKSVVAGWLPLFHDMGLIGNVLQPMYLGIPCILMPPVAFLQKPIRWLKAISKYRATTSGGPNFAYDLCLKKIQPEELANLDLSSWDLAFNGAEPLRVETLKQFAYKFTTCGFKYSAFYPCYGMAETTLFTTGGDKNFSPVIQGIKATDLEQNLVVETEIYSPESRVFVGCGRPYMDTKVSIVNPESLTKCNLGEVGEIWVSSESVASGYWNRPEATKETFQAYLKNTHEGPFLRTGDLGFISHGKLFVTGRLKDVIIIRGRNYYPQDIELSVEKSHQGLRSNSGAAFSVEVEGEERLVVVQEVERTYVRKLNSSEVVSAINQVVSLEHELAIDTIVLLKPGSIPKTSSGKIQRSACRQKFIEGSLDNVVLKRSVNKVPTPAKQIEFSLLYFSSNEAEFTDNKYKLLLEGAKFADKNNFHAIWIPERHFHPFGGLYPEPSVLGSALAMVTEKIRIRPGSVVLPLKNPVRVAEQWSVVDNLSGGRVDISFAKGWNLKDFVLAPENYANRSQIMFDGIKTVHKLWRGESIYLPDGDGKETEIKIYPLPKQPELSSWITCSGGKEGFIQAGAKGANILTALLAQTLEELADKIALYRESRAKNGYDPNSGHVTLMLHTFISNDVEFVRNQVREPFTEYLKSSVNLWKKGSKEKQSFTKQQQDEILAYSFERYFQTAALFGTPQSCLNMVEQIKEIGVNEIACLIDFGVDADSVLSNLNYLNQLRKLANGISDSSKTELQLSQSINTVVKKNLSLTNREQSSKSHASDLIEWLRSYANERINSRLIDERRSIPPHIVLDFGNRGLFGLQVPAEYGGIGLNNVDTLRVVQQLGAIDQTLTLFVGNHNVLGVRPILKYGSLAQKEQLLPKLATGREIAAFALTEPGAGSNPRAISTQAIPNGNGGWLLKGSKIWSGSALWSSVINIFVQQLDSNGEAMGISCFVVGQGTKGLRQGPETLTMGMRGMVQNSVFLEGVSVKEQQLLGEAGAGIKVAQDAMMHGRLGLAAGCIGGMKRCAQLMLRYSKRRLVSTGSLLENPVTLVRLSNLTATITALETLVFTTAELLDKGFSVPEEVYTACKISGPEFFWQAADQLVQLLGGRGYIETNIAPQILRDARVFRIFEGPTEPLSMFLGSRAINKGEELQKFLSEGLGVPQVAQRLKATTEKINQYIKSSQSLFSNQNKAVSWVYFRTGELTTLAILLATVQRNFEDNYSEELRHALSWIELQFEQKFKSILSETTSQSVLENTNNLITQIPNADTITARIYDYAKTIGDLEQTLPGEDYEVDELLRYQTSKSESETDTAVERKNNEGTVTSIEKIDAQSNNKNITPDVASIENLIKNTLAKKLNIDANSIKPQASFVSYGIDSVMAVELIQDLEDCLNQPLEATLLWNFPTVESLAQHLAQENEQTQEIEKENNGLLQEDELKKEEWIKGEL